METLLRLVPPADVDCCPVLHTVPACHLPVTVSSVTPDCGQLDVCGGSRSRDTRLPFTVETCPRAKDMYLHLGAGLNFITIHLDDGIEHGYELSLSCS